MSLRNRHTHRHTRTIHKVWDCAAVVLMCLGLTPPSEFLLLYKQIKSTHDLSVMRVGDVCTRGFVCICK